MSKRRKLESGGYAPGGGAGDDQDVNGQGGDIAGQRENAWVNCLNGAFQILTAALGSINDGVTEIQARGDPSHQVTVNGMRVTVNNSKQRAGQIGGTIVVINGVLGVPQNFNRIPLISTLVRFTDGLVHAINAAGCGISVALRGIVLAQGDGHGLRRAVSRIHSGLGTLNAAIGVFQAAHRAIDQPNLFGAHNVAVPAAAAAAANAGGNQVLNPGLNNGIGDAAQGGGDGGSGQGGIVQNATLHLRSLEAAVRMLWRAFWSIRRVNHIQDVVHHQQNPCGPVKVAVVMLEFHMNQIFEQIVQMRDALNGINDINMHALQLGHELAKILHPFPDQMHWISDAAENIHRSGDRIHSGLLVCIENQIFGPAQTRIQFGLAQLHLALANVLLATQFYADLPPAAVILPEFQIQANVFDNEQGNDNGQGNEGDAVGHE